MPVVGLRVRLGVAKSVNFVELAHDDIINRKFTHEVSKS